MTPQSPKNPNEKTIVLVPHQLPIFRGNWTIGEIRKMGTDLLAWMDSLPLINSDFAESPDENPIESTVEKTEIEK